MIDDNEVIPAEEARALLAAPEPPDPPEVVELRAQLAGLRARHSKALRDAHPVADPCLVWHADAGRPLAKYIRAYGSGGHIDDSGVVRKADKVREEIVVYQRGEVEPLCFRLRGDIWVATESTGDPDEDRTWLLTNAAQILAGTAPVVAPAPDPQGEIIPAEEARATLARPPVSTVAPAVLELWAKQAREIEGALDGIERERQTRTNRLRWHADAGLPLVSAKSLYSRGDMRESMVVLEVTPDIIRARPRGVSFDRTFRRHDEVWVCFESCSIIITDAAALLAGTAPLSQPAPYPYPR